MAKNISTGIEHMLQQTKINEKQSIALSSRWKDLRSKVDAILLAGSTKSADMRQKCYELDNMTNDERLQYITEHWGQLRAEKVAPLLQQLAVIEAEQAKKSQ